MKIIIIIILDCARNVNGDWKKMKALGFGGDVRSSSNSSGRDTTYITGSGVYPIFLMSS